MQPLNPDVIPNIIIYKELGQKINIQEENYISQMIANNGLGPKCDYLDEWIRLEEFLTGLCPSR